MSTTNSTESDERNIAIAEEEPKIEALRAELETAIGDAAFFYERNNHAFDIRYCWWENQSRDGRKHDRGGKPAFPWENAFDGRYRELDKIVNEIVDDCMAALTRMEIQAIPLRAGETDKAGRWTKLLRWLLYIHMADEVRTEFRLLANYVHTYGCGIMEINWRQDLRYEMQTITLEDISQRALQAGGQEALAQTSELLFDPTMDASLRQYVAGISPMLTAREVSGIIRDLRSGKPAQFPMPYLASNRPSICALQTMQDCIFPANTDTLQNARWIARRELLSDDQLLAKVEGREAWSEEFVTEVRKHKGQSWNANSWAMSIANRQRQLGGVWGDYVEDVKDLYEVWHFYYRATRQRIPTIFKTVMHPKVSVAGCHGLSGFEHNKYPFVEILTERACRTIIASRGAPELGDTQQAAIKVQRDSRADRTSITVTPPVKVHTRRGKLAFAFGPASEIPVNKMDEIQFMEVPQNDGVSNEVEASEKRDLNEYFGRPGEGVDPSLVTSKKQARVDEWLKGCKLIGTQILELSQQFLTKAECERVVGILPEPLSVTRPEIQGQFDLMLTFDVRNLNPDFVLEKLKAITTFVLPMDTNALVDRDVIVRYAMAALDPTLADLAVRPADSAQQSEIEDEKNNIARMFSGQEVVKKIAGQNVPLRLQVLQQQLKANPIYPQLIQQRPDFQALLDDRMKFLEFQIQQGKNAQIGIYGTAGAFGGGTGMGGMGSTGGLGEMQKPAFQPLLSQ